jgi:tetratricopeptide (TPR) repeat protein
MKRLILRIVIVVAMVSAVRPIANAGDSPDLVSKGKKFAVIVGVENYENASLGSLKWSIEDARGFASVLKDRGFEESNVRVLIGTRDEKEKEKVAVTDRADRTKILGAIDRFIKASRPQDTLILAFSGHGVRLPGKDGERERSYFCPIDADPARSDSMIDLHVLYEQLKECRAGTKLLFVDAGQFSVSGKKGELDSRDVNSLSKRDFEGLPRNTAAFFGCAVGMDSFEVDELEHGIFMYCVIEAFRSDTAALDRNTGDVTIESLERYINEQVPRLCKKHNKPTQTPTVSYDDPQLKTVIVIVRKYKNLLEQSRELLAQRHYREASAKADEAVELAGEEYATWLWRAGLPEQREKWAFQHSLVVEDATRAIAILEQSSKPNDVDRSLDLAIAYEIRGRNRLAEVRGRKKALKEADLKERELSLKRAEEDFANCIAKMPAKEPNGRGEKALVVRFDALLGRAEVARAMKNVPLARQCFDEISKGLFPVFRPEEFPIRRFKYYLLQVQILNDEGKFAEALKKIPDLSGAAETLRSERRVIDPQAFQAQVKMEEGRTYRGLDKTARAIEKLLSAIDFDSRLDEAIELLGETYLETEQFDEARELYDRSIKVRQSPELNLGMAQALRGLKNLSEAKDYLDEALLLLRDGNPKARARVLFERASLRQEWKPSDLKEIIADCNEAIKLDPNLAEASKLLADAIKRSGGSPGTDPGRR